MAKLISRVSERNLLRNPSAPWYRPWSQWEVAEGTEGLEPAELKRLVKEWHKDDGWVVSGSGYGWRMEVRTSYEREQYRIVEDSFDVASYNAKLAEPDGE